MKRNIQQNSLRMVALLRQHPEGLSTVDLAVQLQQTEKQARTALLRLYYGGEVVRRGIGAAGLPYLYATAPAGTVPPERPLAAPQPVKLPKPAATPAPPAAPAPRRVSPQAEAALRVVGQLTRKTPELLAAQVGCSYPMARRIWAELLEAGQVPA